VGGFDFLLPRNLDEQLKLFKVPLLTQKEKLITRFRSKDVLSLVYGDLTPKRVDQDSECLFFKIVYGRRKGWQSKTDKGQAGGTGFAIFDRLGPDTLDDPGSRTTASSPQ